MFQDTCKDRNDQVRVSTPGGEAPSHSPHRDVFKHSFPDKNICIQIKIPLKFIL